jgi:hypothetical protein
MIVINEKKRPKALILRRLDILEVITLKARFPIYGNLTSDDDSQGSCYYFGIIYRHRANLVADDARRCHAGKKCQFGVTEHICFHAIRIRLSVGDTFGLTKNLFTFIIIINRVKKKDPPFGRPLLLSL